MTREESDGSDVHVELRDVADRVEITADLPDGAADDAEVSVSASAVRIRVRPTDGPSADDVTAERDRAFERTVALTRRVVVERASVSRDDSTLTVSLPEANPA